MRIQVGFALCVVAAIAAPPCAAQDYSGFQRAGEALGSLLFGRSGDSKAYRDAYQQRMETEAAYWGAVNAKREADEAEQRLQMVTVLKEAWMQAGLPENEASALASAWEYKPEQEAIIARAERDGRKATLLAAGQAYREYRYLLANQLLIAGLIVPQEPPAQGQPPPPNE